MGNLNFFHKGVKKSVNNTILNILIINTFI